MRTLLIDNYDSFTHNLAHQIHAATGREPVVVANDDPEWRIGRLAEFDAVVISPGPGTPERPADFGICREVVERCEAPLLGVCLGHQGIAAWHGGTVGRAPEPRHGRTSPVLHDGTGLFDGIPSPFEAVRYHSLTVTKLPDDLEALAHTPEGVLMALRHRRRPMWGVQFHPESICTRHGDRLLGNFVSLARTEIARSVAVRAVTGRAVTARSVVAPTEAARTARTADADRPAAPAPARSYELLVERLETGWDGEAAFDALFRAGPYAFWLDSSRTGPGPEGGRFSIMGDAGGPLARVAEADVWTGTVSVRTGAHRRLVTADFLDWLDADLRATRVELPREPALPCDFALGWVGYLGYELKAQCGGRVAHRSAEPDAVMVFADRAVVLDHVAGRTYVMALAPAADAPGASPEAGRERARAWLRETAGRLAELAEPGRTCGARPGAGSAADAAGSAEPAEPAGSTGPFGPRPPAVGPVSLRHDRARYLDLVAIAQEEIAAGETYEVCLTNLAEAATAPRGTDAADAADDFDDVAWRAYRVLRRAAPAPFGALLGFGRTAVLSTSPERFLRVTADGRVESRPIKGTRPRGATPREDEALRRELAVCEKDRSENLMIVDLVRNDLGRCAEPGSVEVAGLFEVETYDTVHQLVSTVRARLRADATAVDCVRAAFPGGSMTGAPKVRTMRIIDRLEGGPRGVYSGAIGYFSPTGAADLSIVIRTAVLTPGRIRYGTGGAIVALSDPVAEFEETAVKAAPLLALTGGGFPGATAEREKRPPRG